MTDDDALTHLDQRIRTLLPEDYQARYQDLQPVPMRSAGLVYGDDGQVAWDRIWGSFCDLAMAGGPPHKGRLLSPGSPEAIAAAPARYDEVVEEIRRGVWLAAALDARPAPDPGWVRVHTFGEAMAGWLLRAITMENVAVRGHRAAIDLPAAPSFRVEREIKNVVTVIAKTTHYWMGHMPRAQRIEIATLLTALANESPLVQPCWPVDGQQADAAASAAAALTDRLRRETGVRPSAQQYAGWCGVECGDVRAAVWTMRALVAHNVLARREGTALFVPVNPERDPAGDRVSAALKRVVALATARQVF